MKNNVQASEDKFYDSRANFSEEFLLGLKKSLPIIMGYIPVSFTFGIMARGEGLDAFTTVIMSMTSFTSAGQFAGTNIIVANGTFMEMAITTFIINIRYTLMSLSLSQKIEKMSVAKKLILAFGITDETFTVSSFETGKVSFPFMLGLSLFSYLSWISGTLLGATASNFLSLRLQNSMGIALYGMFLALIVPNAKNDKKILSVVVVALIVSSLFRYINILSGISSGWTVIISTIIASTFGAIAFPKGEEID